MVKFKNIRIKMKGGKSRTQRVKVLASGKYKFVPNLTRSKVSRKARPKTKSRRKTMARRKRRRGKRSFTIPLAPTLALAGQFVRPAPQQGWSILDNVMQGNFPQALQGAREIFTGVGQDGSFHIDWLVGTYGPIVAGMLIHKFIGGAPLNLNRMLASAGVPIVRI